MIPHPITIDFETEAIQPRPHYPPKPIGVSIKILGQKAHYYAWGHTTENNCTFNEARLALAQVWYHADGLLFQNGKFDADVAETFMGMPRMPWSHYHDTMFLLFLDDPNQKELSLKPSAERILKMPPEEQDAVADWLIAKQPVPGVKISKSKTSDFYFMKYLKYAPGALVGKYADGDVIRTEKLFAYLYPKTKSRKMLEAYDRERQLMPILLGMEREGVPIAAGRLHNDVMSYAGTQSLIDSWLRKQLKDNSVNLDSGPELAKALEKSGKLIKKGLPQTDAGHYQTNKIALLNAVTDKTMLAVLQYRAQLNTCMSTFMLPWLITAEQSNGLIYTTWNQVKAPNSHADHVGARTGRLSSTPNFQNIPKIFAVLFRHEAQALKLLNWKEFPKSPIDLFLLPKIRSYITPFPDEVFLDRDYSQQELRILAHFDGGSLMTAYINDPWMDIHTYAQETLASQGLIYDRGRVKNTNFGLVYGMGNAALALRNKMPVDEAKILKKAMMRLYPGLEEMYDDMKCRARNDLPFRTWGGREYYCEPPSWSKKFKRPMTFEYKMVNGLIQGSAADCTKEAIIRFHDVKDSSWRMLLSLHDEEAISAPKQDAAEAMDTLRWTMESVEFSVPMLSEGSMSDTNWNEKKPYDKKGVLCG
jgi:DNA polymerase I-like protein with 3'-5' exonuclease and polymerase domains